MAKKGGAWKVAYADFVTAMMAFFLVMWITAQSKDVKESVSRYFEDPLGSADTQRLTAEEGIQGASAMGAYPNGGLNTRGLAQADPNSTPRLVSQTLTSHKPPKLRIFKQSHVSESRGTLILFQDNTATMTEAGKQQLAAIAPAFLGKPNKIEVRGHSSRKPLPADSPYKTSWDLCYARCIAAMNGLIEGGVEPERIRLSQDAEFEPYTNRREAEWQDLNARVEVFAIDEFVYDHKVIRESPGGFFGEPTPPKASAKKETQPHH